MLMPVVTEISPLSAHHREAGFVRWPLPAVPEHVLTRGEPDPIDALRRLAAAGTPALAR